MNRDRKEIETELKKIKAYQNIADINVEILQDIHKNKQHHIWYTGNLSKISCGNIVIYTHVVGRVSGALFKDARKLNSFSLNCGSTILQKYLPVKKFINDNEFVNLVKNHKKKEGYSVYLAHSNYIEHCIYDHRTKKTIKIRSQHKDVINGIKEAFIWLDKYIN